MTTESAVFLAAIVFAFVAFGVLLVWVDVYENHGRRTNQQ